MSNPTAVSPATEAAVEAYLATWNETDAARRQAPERTLQESSTRRVAAFEGVILASTSIRRLATVLRAGEAITSRGRTRTCTIFERTWPAATEARTFAPIGRFATTEKVPSPALVTVAICVHLRAPRRCCKYCALW